MLLNLVTWVKITIRPLTSREKRLRFLLDIAVHLLLLIFWAVNVIFIYYLVKNLFQIYNKNFSLEILDKSSDTSTTDFNIFTMYVLRFAKIFVLLVIITIALWNIADTTSALVVYNMPTETINFEELKTISLISSLGLLVIISNYVYFFINI